jgi:hypothetical protein
MDLARRKLLWEGLKNKGENQYDYFKAGKEGDP